MKPPGGSPDRKTNGWSPGERRLLKRLATPEEIQQFLDEEVGYNKEPDGETCRSPRRVLRDRLAHCSEGALLAAAALRFHGRPPLVLQIRAVRDDDHVLALFTEGAGNGRIRWGSVAKSNFSGLRYRAPVYRSVRELVMSYFEHYYNLAGERSLRGWTNPVDLSRFDADGWEFDEGNLWDLSAYLATRRVHPALPPGGARRLPLLDARLYHAGLHGSVGIAPEGPYRTTSRTPGVRPRARSARSSSRSR